jgi:ribosomal protein S18 acetylase RimI-like enzyme
MVTLTPFDPTVHADLLEQWLNRQHVRDSWGDPAANLESVMALRPPAGGALIVADGELVGFVQWQRIGARELLESGVDVPDDETFDIDIFIADAGQLGRGIGPKAIEVLMKKLEEEGAAKRATLFTSVENERAKRAYEKAGFRERSKYLDAEHGWTNVMMAEIRSGRQEA